MIAIKLLFLILVTISIHFNIFSLVSGQQQQPTGPNANTNIPNEGAPKPIVHVIIEGTENVDKIKGGNGNDRISGNNGDDTLHGGLGNDKLFGYDGNHKLKGGKGADTYYLLYSR